jgi:hypothetical protein
MQQLKKGIIKFCKKASAIQMDGIGVIEIILILVIIIGLVLIFRNQIGGIMHNAFENITGDSDEINSDIDLDDYDGI